MQKFALRSKLILLGGFVLLAIAKAQAFYAVTVDTSSLVGALEGPFFIDFQLTDGRGIGDANTTVRITDFSFGGGTPSGDPFFFGGATGTLSGEVLLLDSSFLNDFTQGFEPGTLLAFNLFLAPNVDVGRIPDRLSFAILTAGGTAIPTTGPGDVLLGSDLNSLSPDIESYRSDLSRTPIEISRPQVTLLEPPAGTSRGASEPPVMLLIALGLALAGFMRRRIDTGQTA